MHALSRNKYSIVYCSDSLQYKKRGVYAVTYSYSISIFGR